MHLALVFLWVAVAVFMASFIEVEAATACFHLGDCNGHGSCDTTNKKCDCFEGWGAADDITLYKSADCSQRVCPAGKAWVDVPTSASTAHFEAECSNQGLCDRSTGLCRCFSGFSGDACQRSACPNDCSGHGKCVSISQMASETNAVPVGDNLQTYGGDESGTTWDENKIYGCVCDSTWTVGLEDTETQEPLWFGPDCSLKHCPTGDDPMTGVDETNCTEKAFNGAIDGNGAFGNLCHIDCSNRGLCDHSSGLCRCFEGFYGDNCNLRSVLAKSQT